MKIISPAEIDRLVKNLAGKSAAAVIKALRGLVLATQHQPNAHETAIRSILQLLAHPRVSVIESACVALGCFPLDSGAVRRLREIGACCGKDR